MEDQKKYLIIIFILALSLRILFFLFQGSWDSSVIENKIIPMGTDQRGYHQLALNFIENGKLSFKPELPPVVLRTPVYPLFISAIYYTFGEKPWLVLLFQNVIDSLTAIIIFFTVTILFNKKTGFIAALLYAIEPHMILYSNTLYSDTLFVFTLALFSHFLIKSIKTAEKNDLIFGISATFLGLSVLVKPAGTYMFILVILILFYLYRKNLRVVIKKSFFFTLIYLMTLSPWLIRNYTHYGEFFLSNSGEYNLLAINITPMEIPKRNKPQHVVERELRNEADSLMLSEGVKPHWNKKPQDYWEGLHLQQDYNKTRYWKKVALKYIMNDPVTFFKYYGLDIAHTLFNLATSEFSENLGIKKGKHINLKEEPNLLNTFKKFVSGKSAGELLIGSFVLLYLAVTYISFIMGFVRLIKAEQKLLLFISVLFAFYFLLIAGAGGLARFKMPAVPFYIGISAYGLNFTMNFLKRKINKSSEPAN